MEKIQLEYPAGGPANGRALAGVVASGDLEVLLEPNAGEHTVVSVQTSVNGYGSVWRAVLDRALSTGDLPAVKLEINDFGATPGVVRMRIAQAFEDAAGGAAS